MAAERPDHGSHSHSALATVLSPPFLDDATALVTVSSGAPVVGLTTCTVGGVPPGSSGDCSGCKKVSASLTSTTIVFTVSIVPSFAHVVAGSVVLSSPIVTCSS